jgi:hypothetical protein
VAENILLGGISQTGGQGVAAGGGILDATGDHAVTVLDNNTITQNTIDGGNDYASSGLGGLVSSGGAGIFVPAVFPIIPNTNTTLLNNLIQGNQSINSSATDLFSTGFLFSFSTGFLDNASNNFIGSVSIDTVNPTTNIVGNPQLQLGSSTSSSGGTIYYPLFPGIVSIGAGTPSVLSTIAAVEGTTLANVVDELGNPIPSNGPIDLGAIQSLHSPALPVTGTRAHAFADAVARGHLHR